MCFAIAEGATQVRVDPASVADPNADHRIGQLLVDADGVGIWCGWADENEDYSRIVRLGSWEQGRVVDPAVKFNRWSLGSLAPDGAWFQLAQSSVADLT